jgi:alpha-amylase
LGLNAVLQLTVVILPANATDKTVLWNVSKPQQTIATVDGNGLVKTIKAGTATVTASVDGMSGSSVITVQNQAEV